MNRYSWWLALVLPCAAVAADPKKEAFDWPQWQGPDRNAVSREKGLLQEWPKDGPPVAWTAKNLGGGDSAPSVAGGKLFGMSNRGSDEVVWALDEKDGKELWVTRIGPAVQQRVPQSKEGPGGTPAVDGDKVYALGVGGELVCLNVNDGKSVWQVNYLKEFAGVPPMWNYRESPLIDGNKVICTPGGPDATLAALDKKTGKTLWMTKVTAGGGGGQPGRPGGRPGFGGGGSAAYSSPIAIDFDGKRQYVQLTAKALVGVAADDGKVLWTYDKVMNGLGINCSTPIHHDGHVFAATAYNTGGGLVKLTTGGDTGVKAEEVYFTKKMENHHGGVILHDGCLYGANGGNGGGYLICLDFKTGKVNWDARDADEREKRVEKGAIAMADGRLYYRTEKEGIVLLIEPSAKGYVEKGRFPQPGRSRTMAWAHPVIANGKLYIRDQDALYCYDVKAK